MTTKNKTNYLDRTEKNIIDTLSCAMNCSSNHLCLLHHNNEGFKCYTDMSSALSKQVSDAIMLTWNVKEENISIERYSESWWASGSNGYIIKVQY